jgi:hypothetical protein
MDLLKTKQTLIVIVSAMDDLMGYIESLPPDNATVMHINHLKFLEGYYAGSLSRIEGELKDKEAKQCQLGQSAF